MIITNQSNLNYDSVLPDGQTVAKEKDSNIVSTEIIDIDKIKSTDKVFVEEGEQASQTVIFTNTSNFTLQNLFFNDNMGDGATHVAGSVFIDDVNYPTYDVKTGFALADLPSGGSTKINYIVLANNPKTKDIIENFASLQFDVSDQSRTRTFNQNTNLVSFAVISTGIKVTKSVDRSYAIAGDTLQYTSVVENTGSQLAKNVVFKDILQSGITFVDGSVKIDGISYPSYNPILGFPLSDINAGESKNVEFDVTVN